jgi:hypothetical protein
MMYRAARWSIGVAIAIFVLFGGSLVLAQIFGLGPYQGGTLKTVYRFTSEGDRNPGTMTFEILPEGERFRVRMLYDSLEKQEDIEKLSKLFVGFGHREKNDIDLLPLLALDEREIEPNKDLVLPGGARLQTQEKTKIAGVDAVMGIYTHKDFPDQRVIIAISDVATRKLLFYPPLLQLEKQKSGQFQIQDKIELLEFSHKK